MANEVTAGAVMTPVGIDTYELVGNVLGIDLAGMMTKCVELMVTTVLTPVGTLVDLTKTGDDGILELDGKTTLYGAVGDGGGERTECGIVSNEVVGNVFGNDFFDTITTVVLEMVITETPVGTDEDLTKTGLVGRLVVGGNEIV